MYRITKILLITETMSSATEPTLKLNVEFTFLQCAEKKTGGRQILQTQIRLLLKRAVQSGSAQFVQALLFQCL